MRRAAGILFGIAGALMGMFLGIGIFAVPDPSGKATFGVISALSLGVSWLFFRWGAREWPYATKSVAALPAQQVMTRPIETDAPPTTWVQPKTPPHAYEGGGTVIADGISTRVLIRYHDAHDEDTERTVLVARVRGHSNGDGYVPELMFGFCELRKENRTFLFGRTRAAFDAETGEEIGDVERYLVGRGNQLVPSVTFSKLTPEEEAEAARVREWLKAHGGRGIRHLTPAPLVTIEARGNGDATSRFKLSVETIEQYAGRPFAIAGKGKHVEKGARPRHLRFTLQGFHTPEWEIAALYPEDEKLPVPDVAMWLDHQGRKLKQAGH